MPDKKNQYKEYSDAELVHLITKEGKRALFEVLYERYASLIYRKCIALTKDQSIAKDLMHDIMIKLFLNIAQFEGRSNFSLWVNTISYNHCMQYFKLKKRLLMTSEDMSLYDTIAVEEIEQENKEIQAIKSQQLALLLEQLKSEYRLILIMRYFSEMSVQEIADSLEIGESAVKMRLKRGREKLAKLYKKQHYE